MSLEAMVWALKHAAVPDPLAKLVLIGLADHAAGDGRAAFPSATTLAEYAGCSERTVRYKLAYLEGSGLIERGDQTLTAGYRYRPVVWNLALPQTGRICTPQPRQNLHPSTARGADHNSQGVQPVADKPSLEPSNSSRALTSPRRPELARCRKHAGLADPPACRDCRTAREAAERAARDAAAIGQAAERAEQQRDRRARLQAVAECGLCDSAGYRGSWRCDHDPDAGDRARRGAALARANLLAGQ